MRSIKPHLLVEGHEPLRTDITYYSVDTVVLPRSSGGGSRWVTVRPVDDVRALEIEGDVVLMELVGTQDRFTYDLASFHDQFVPND